MHTSKSRSVTNLAMAQAAQYASTPHLFVFESSDDAPALHKPAPIYQSAADVRPRGQQAVQLITEKYDSLRNLAQREEHALAVQEADISQVEAFFAGHRTQVIVCRALANMYLSSESNSWELKYTGIPALVVDAGDTRSRGRRQIQLVLAEKGSGFMLWRDVVDNLSSYSAAEPSFHTMHLSSDHRQRVGFSFDDTGAAKAFQAQLETLCSDPENIALSGPAHKKRRKKKVERYVRPRKEDISQPCCFQHVTSVGAADRERLYTLQSLVGGGKTA